MTVNTKAMTRRVEIAVCKSIEAASERDGCIKAGQIGADLAAEFLSKMKTDPKFVFAFVAQAGAELVNRFCDMPRNKWPIPPKRKLPATLRSLPFAMRV